MSVVITVQLSPEAIALSNRFKESPERFPQAIKRGMDYSLAIVSGRIQTERLTGHGPFPVEQHRLGERTGQLKLRTRATPARIETSSGGSVSVAGAIGSSVKYAAVHEFGFNGPVQCKSKKGKIFSRQMKMPERAPFRTGIRENVPYIGEQIQKAILDSLQ